MRKTDLRIIFMGTPEFAVETLRALVENGYNVVAVVTQSDKPVGRHGSVLQPSEVKKYAVEHGLPVLQPEKMKDPAFIEQLRSYHANLQVVVAFRMLPEVVWAMPEYGTFNVHAALLPQYRGAAPINWAVINGETETGVTTFFLDHDIDTGRIIMKKTFAIPDEADVEYVYDGLMHLGAQLCLETLDAIIAADGHPATIAQDDPQFSILNSHCEPHSGLQVGEFSILNSHCEPHSDLQVGEFSILNSQFSILNSQFSILNSQFSPSEALKPAPKIFKETCEINWTKTVKQVYDFVRGLSPVPGAWTTLIAPDGKETVLKIYKTCKMVHGSGGMVHDAGTLVVKDKSLFVACADGLLEIVELQLAGKKRMAARDFLNGMKNIETYHVKKNSDSI